MATIDLDILDAAYEDGVFKKPLTDRQNRYVRASVMSAWEIIKIIQSRLEMGIEGGAIAQEMGMHYNTVKYYLRWMVEKKLIEFETPKGDQDQPMQSRIYRIRTL
jgi:transcription initiation factor IIE alpha subunit